MRNAVLRRTLRAAGLVALLLVAAVFGLLLWITSTQAGARRAISWLGAILKGSFDVERVEGSLRGPLVLHGLHYHTETLEVRVEETRLDWRLSELLRKRLDVTAFDARTVRITSRSRSDQPTEKLPDLHLPVNVIVRSAEIRDVRIEGADPNDPLRLDSVSLVTSAIADTVRVDRLSVEGPSFRAGVSGTVRPRGDYPVDLRLAWSARPAGRPPLAGEGTLTGDLEALRVVHELSSPFPARLEATLKTPMRDLAFEATLAFSKLNTRRIRPDAPAAELAGRLAASGRPNRFSARGTVEGDVETNQLGRVRAELELSRSADDWQLSRLVLHLPGTPAEISARGSVRLASGSPKMDLDLGWRRISWPLRGKPLITSGQGTGRISGTADAYALRVDAELEGAGLPRGRWRLAGNGSRRGMDLSSFAGSVLDGAISGSGRFVWSPEPRWEIAARGDGLDTAMLDPRYPGRIEFEARSQGKMAAQGPFGSVELPRLEGTLRGQPVEASARVDFAGRTTFLRQCSLRLATARARASGSFGDAWDLRWTLDASDLQPVLADARGSLHASGSVSGAKTVPRVLLEASGRSLAFGDRKAASLTIDGDVDLAERGTLRLDLAATGLVPAAGRRPIDTLRLSGRGTRGDHTVRLDVASRDGTLVLLLAGGVSGKRWRGEIRGLDLQSRDAGRWTLAAPAELALSSDAASLRGFCWTSGAARLCADADWREGSRSTLTASLGELPFSLFSPWLPPSVQVTGTLNGRISAETGGGRVLADAALTAGPGEIRYAAAEGEQSTVAYRDAGLRIAATANGASATMSLALEGVGKIHGELAMPRYNAAGVPAASQPLQGRLQVDLSDLGFVHAFVTQAEKIGGAVRGDWTIAGTAGAPRVSGDLTLSGLRAELPDTGLQLHDSSLAVRGDGSETLSVEGRLRARQGELALSGRVPLAPKPGSPAQIHLSGSRFLLFDTYERRAYVSPELSISYDGRTISAAGDLAIPEARLEVMQKLATFPVSSDVVFVGHSAGELQARAGPAHAIRARVRLTLGDLVSVKAMGFDGRVGGSVLLMEEPAQPTSGTGELVIDSGTYKAYGQDLTIERGRIRFAGPIDNPGLDLQASRKVKDGTVAGVKIRGTLRRPETTIYSEPPMAQSEALAYLILGHPLDQASAAEGNLVANAATSLGIKAGNLLGKKVASRFGLETARIETTNGNLQQASLIVGKYLSPRLYLEYGIGIFDQVSRFRINYLINKKWTVRAETGTENGADVLYTIER